MSTPKELNIQPGDTVRFIPSDPDTDMSMLAGIVGGEFGQNAQELVWDADFIAYGLVGQCTNVVAKPDGTKSYKFSRVRDNGELGAMSIPVKENEDCISAVIFAPHTT